MIITIIILIGVSIGVIVLMPGVVQSHKTSIHKNAVEATFHNMNFAKSVATNSDNEITVSFNANESWCIGFSDKGECDCTTKNACMIDSYERTISYLDFPEILLKDITFSEKSYTIIRADHKYSFVKYDTGSFIFEEGNNRVKLEKQVLDRIKICTLNGDIAGYSSC